MVIKGGYERPEQFLQRQTPNIGIFKAIGNAMKLKHKFLAKFSFIYFQRLEQDNNKIDFKFTGLNGVLDQYIFDNNNFFLSFYEKSFQKQLGK